MMSLYYGHKALNLLRFTTGLRIFSFQGIRNHSWFNNVQPARKITLSSSSFKYERERSERDHRHKIVLLVDESGRNQGEMSFEEAAQIAKRGSAEGKSLRLLWVNEKDKTKMPVYKLILTSGRRTGARSLKSPKIKNVEVTDRIEFNDLYFRVKRMERYMQKGHPVKLSVRSKQGRDSTAGDKLNIIKQVQQEMEVDFTVENPVEEGRGLVSCVFRPTRDGIGEEKLE